MRKEDRPICEARDQWFPPGSGQGICGAVTEIPFPPSRQNMDTQFSGHQSLYQGVKFITPGSGLNALGWGYIVHNES